MQNLYRKTTHCIKESWHMNSTRINWANSTRSHTGQLVNIYVNGITEVEAELSPAFSVQIVGV